MVLEEISALFLTVMVSMDGKGVDRLRCFSWTSAVHVSKVRES